MTPQDPSASDAEVREKIIDLLDMEEHPDGQVVLKNYEDSRADWEYSITELLSLIAQLRTKWELEARIEEIEMALEIEDMLLVHGEIIHAKMIGDNEKTIDPNLLNARLKSLKANLSKLNGGK